MNQISKDKISQIKLWEKNYPTMRHAARCIGIDYKTLREYAKQFGVFETRQGKPYAKKKNPNAIPIQSILNGSIEWKGSTSKLKEKLFDAGLKNNGCEKCGISRWKGKPIVCQLHHINGNSKDNRLENLQILCPNCHSQTPGWAGKSSGKNKK